MTFHLDTFLDLKSKVFIVTDENFDIDYYIVDHLAEHDAHVYMCARFSEKSTAVIVSIKKTHLSVNIDLLQINLMNLVSVVAIIKHFFTLKTVLHDLINNADIMTTLFEMIKDDPETQ